MKQFEFNFYGLVGEVTYELCLDETMLGTITILGNESKFSYNSGLDVLPIINGCGKKEEREFLYNLIKDEYEKEVKTIRLDKEFFTIYMNNSWLVKMSMVIGKSVAL